MREKLIYILISSVILSSCNFTSADAYFNQAFEYEEKGDLPKAIETIVTFMKNDTLDLSQESILWLKKLYSSYDISKLFIS